MALTFAGLRPKQHLIYSFLITIVHLLCRNPVLSDMNKYSLCLRERNHPLHKKVDGAVITSKSEDNLDCIITFQTDTILQRFMLRFEKLALDCNDHLIIYDGAHALGHHKADLSCRSTRTDVGTIFTQGNFLTLKYTTDPYSKADNGFRLVITAFKDAPVHCKDHKCLNSFCISRDLSCDGVNHCGDNSDETSHASCLEIQANDMVWGMPFHIFIAAMVVVFVICSICVVSVAICLCRREHLIQHQQQRIAMQQQLGSAPVLAHPTAYSNQMIGGGQQRFATLPLERIRDKPPPYPGNFFSPAAGNAHSQVVYATK